MKWRGLRPWIPPPQKEKKEDGHSSSSSGYLVQHQRSPVRGAVPTARVPGEREDAGPLEEVGTETKQSWPFAKQAK